MLLNFRILVEVGPSQVDDVPTDNNDTSIISSFLQDQTMKKSNLPISVDSKEIDEGVLPDLVIPQVDLVKEVKAPVELVIEDVLADPKTVGTSEVEAKAFEDVSWVGGVKEGGEEATNPLA